MWVFAIPINKYLRSSSPFNFNLICNLVLSAFTAENATYFRIKPK